MDTTNPARSKLRIPNDPMYRLLREGCIIEFNAKKASGEKVDLRGCDLRGSRAAAALIERYKEQPFFLYGLEFDRVQAQGLGLEPHLHDLEQSFDGVRGQPIPIL